MKPPYFPGGYTAPRNLATAIETLALPGAVAVGGGTDLVPLRVCGLRGALPVAGASPIVDLTAIRELCWITVVPLDGSCVIFLGAGLCLAELAAHPMVAGRVPALHGAIASTATPAIRQMATLGGNLLARPRCAWFRGGAQVREGEAGACFKRGGTTCPAQEAADPALSPIDPGPCRAVHPSDPAVALVAHRATVHLHGPAGERSLAIEELFVGPDGDGRRETVLGEAEIIRGVSVPLVAGTRGAYAKLKERTSFGFALASAAVSGRVERSRDGVRRLTGLGLALGGLSAAPVRLAELERTLEGEVPSEALFTRAAGAALAGARTRPGDPSAYKLGLARTLLARALGEAFL